jgi:hypothetical protein
MVRMCGGFTKDRETEVRKADEERLAVFRDCFVAGSDGIRACYASMMVGLEETERATQLDLWSLQNFALRTKSHSMLVAEWGRCNCSFCT